MIPKILIGIFLKRFYSKTTNCIPRIAYKIDTQASVNATG